ncbi:MAG: dihydrolipoyl dehydrogenase [Planctomycetota bacterium]
MAETIAADVLVLGAGPGGYAAAFRAADLGKQVVMVDRAPRPGGICLHHGCIPSKALLHAGDMIRRAREASTYGLDFGTPRIDTEKLDAWKQQVIDELAAGIDSLAKQRDVRIVHGRAHFAGPDRIEVLGEHAVMITFEHCIIATGSRSVQVRDWRLPSGRVVDSYDALNIHPLPENLLVIGGGYIGLELGQVYSALGTRVQVVEVTEGVLPGVDRDLARPLQQRIAEMFVGVHLDTRVTGLKDVDGGVKASFSGEVAEPDTVFDKVLVAVGRRPNSDGIGLENTGARVDDQGFIINDAQHRTTQANIYAIGDVAGQPLLAHKASYEGKVAAEVLAGTASADDRRAVPAVVFTDPEVAWCGVTETQAQEDGFEVAVARFPWKRSGRAKTLGSTDGMTKVIVDPASNRIIGVGIVGRGADNMISEGVFACEMGASVEDLARSIHPHPTLSETLSGAAEVFLGSATDVLARRRRGGGGPRERADGEQNGEQDDDQDQDDEQDQDDDQGDDQGGDQDDETGA